jgi:hypothetical protein
MRVKNKNTIFVTRRVVYGPNSHCGRNVIEQNDKQKIMTAPKSLCFTILSVKIFTAKRIWCFIKMIVKITL